MSNRFFQLFVVAISFVVTCSAMADGDRMRVAEWGTFTVLQNNQGIALPGVNVNEERLPRFVHQLSRNFIPRNSEFSPVIGLRAKGIPANYPYAIMRMETPIIYFYPPKSQQGPIEMDVSVGFNGGWVSEWYPHADVNAPGFKNSFSDMGSISPDKTGTIHWKNLRVGSRVGENISLPQTDEHVWLAPRDVDSAKVTTSNGESEQYLFYRGVANIESPLRIQRSSKGQLTVETNGWLMNKTDECRFAAIWLADVKADGTVAFRQLPAVAVSGKAERQQVATTTATFSNMQYSKENLAKLRDSMNATLIDEGLTQQEAAAMLETWKLSYFQSPGLRLFYTLPREWTDAVLPLKVSRPADITRIMIGRIEMIKPEQQRLVDKIAAGPVSTTKWFLDRMNEFPPAERQATWAKLYNEKTTLKELGMKVPADYQAYMDIGRFRDAILLDRMRRGPNENLKKFTRNYFVHKFSQTAPAQVERQRTPVAGK